MSTITDTARAAALAARQAKALDKLYRFNGHVESYRTRILHGDFAFRYQHIDGDFHSCYGLIEHADAAEAISERGQRGLAFATYNECAKLVVDACAHLPLVVVRGYDDVTLTPPTTLFILADTEESNS